MKSIKIVLMNVVAGQQWRHSHREQSCGCEDVVILEPRKIKSDTVSTASPSISHEVVGPDAMIFVFCLPYNKRFNM